MGESLSTKPKVIIRPRTGQSDAERKFLFGENLIRKDGLAPALKNYREKARQAFLNSSLPDQNSELWKRSSLKDFHPEVYKSIIIPLKDSVWHDQEINGLEDSFGTIIQEEKGTSISLLEDLLQKGVVFSPLSEAEKSHPTEMENIIGKVINPAENLFTSATGAFAQFGSLIKIPAGLTLDKPLVIKIKAGGTGKAFFSHHLIHLEQRCQAVILIENSSDEGNEGDSLLSSLVEVILEEGAHLTLVELQSLDETTWNFGYSRVLLGKDSTLDWTVGATGGKFSKEFSSLKLTGVGSRGKISGFYFADGKQIIDHETSQDHLAPNTTSDLLFKGALQDESRTVWRGMIYVAPEANKTDGYQANRNLILSEKARADSIPGLEILTDDVRCTHGATIGRIDQDQVFYLESRGIPKREAEKLIVEGFFESVLERIPMESIRNRFKAEILRKMNK
jgi:Fe-S cluster assembly protein SufD